MAAPAVLMNLQANTSLLERVKTALDTIAKADIKVDVEGIKVSLTLAPPLTPAQGASLPAWNLKTATSAWQAQKSAGEEQRYLCAANFLWIAPLRLAVPGVPLSERAVTEMIAHDYGGGPVMFRRPVGIPVMKVPTKDDSRCVSFPLVSCARASPAGLSALLAPGVATCLQ